MNKTYKENIKEWLEKELKKRNKTYTHFDKKPDLSKNILKKSPQIFFEDFFSVKNISKRAFWPFIHFTKTENRYKKNKEDPKKLWKFQAKDREIFYASYFDWFIFSFYSFLIAKKYDELLKKSNLDHVVLAYRHIDIEWEWWKWKNNIHFAKEIFEEIDKQKNCYVFAFDISSFFDNLDWDILKNNICAVLWINELTNDWKNIFNAITKYSYIDQEDIRNYNLIQNKVINTDKFKKARKKYKKDNFIENYIKSLLFILSKNFILAIKTLSIKENLIKRTKYYKDNYWIAQWTPISGVMANLYMYDFDLYLNKYCKANCWKYYRYSDDILIVVPYNKDNKEILFNEIQKEVFEMIDALELKIQQKKTDIFEFNSWVLSKSFTYNETSDKFEEDENIKLLQYLGFSFDWKNVLLRNKTLTRHYRRMIESIKRLARLKPRIKDWKVIRKSRIKWDKILLWEMNKRYTHSWAQNVDNRYWNFYWYVKASYEIMKDLQDWLWINNKIKKQMSKYAKNYKEVIDCKIFNKKREKK